MVRVHALGRVVLEGDQPGAATADEHDLGGPQAALLLAFLVVGRQAVSRDATADAVWSGNPPPGWSSALNSLVSRLRSALERVGVDRGVLATGGGTIELLLPPGSWVDLEAATRSADRARGHLRQGDVDRALAGALAASAVLRRPFLPGRDGPWVDGVRRSVDDLAYRNLLTLAEAWIRRGDPVLAAAVAHQAIGIDPLRESGPRLAIAAHLAAGEPTLAHQLYRRYEQLLDRELGVAPTFPPPV